MEVEVMDELRRVLTRGGHVRDSRVASPSMNRMAWGLLWHLAHQKFGHLADARAVAERLVLFESAEEPAPDGQRRYLEAVIRAAGGEVRLLGELDERRAGAVAVEALAMLRVDFTATPDEVDGLLSRVASDVEEYFAVERRALVAEPEEGLLAFLCGRSPVCGDVLTDFSTPEPSRWVDHVGRYERRWPDWDLTVVHTDVCRWLLSRFDPSTIVVTELSEVMDAMGVDLATGMLGYLHSLVIHSLLGESVSLSEVAVFAHKVARAIDGSPDYPAVEAVIRWGLGEKNLEIWDLSGEEWAVLYMTCYFAAVAQLRLPREDLVRLLSCAELLHSKRKG